MLTLELLPEQNMDQLESAWKQFEEYTIAYDAIRDRLVDF